MIPLTLREIAGVVGGTVHGPNVTVTAPAGIDSGLAEPGGLYAAVVGEQVDGHEYAAQAMANGAVAVLGRRATDYPTVVVPDVPQALQRLAHHVLHEVTPTVIALTGSRGDSGTEDLLAVLTDLAPTVATYGSFVDELGLALAVLRATADTRYLVLEVGGRDRSHLRALRAITPSDVSRIEVRERPDGVTIINDAYDADPDSMRAALKGLAAIGRARGPATRTVAVLAEMRELGESSRQEHDAVGRLAVRLDIHQLVVVGEAARTMHLGAYLEGSWGEESVFVRDNDEALAWLREHIVPGDVVLVKASRGALLDQVADGLLSEDPPC